MPEPPVTELIEEFIEGTEVLSPEELFRWLVAGDSSGGKTIELLPALAQACERRHGLQAACNLLMRLQVAKGMRRPRLALYDHTLHFIGGAQKYGCTVAEALRGDFQITLIANRKVELRQLETWYNLDLRNCEIKIIPLPFFDEFKGDHLDPSRVASRRQLNPFHRISHESGNYDFFINNSMVEMVYPLAPQSIFLCHFPERRASSYYYVPDYQTMIHNSLYTAGWIQKKWKVPPGVLIHPPVDMIPTQEPEKQNIILSSARFDPGGNKQQLRMVRLYQSLISRAPQILSGWKLVLVGGSTTDNPYLRRIQEAFEANTSGQIEVRVNLSGDELRECYGRAKIFWHLCGYGQNDPGLIEHFGMTTVEAMQNGCVPLVFGGGGQMEIVEDGVSGFLIQTPAELAERTCDLATNPEKLRGLALRARERGKQFQKEVCSRKIKTLFAELLQQYKSGETNRKALATGA